jgi:hypothetical protein
MQVLPTLKPFFSCVTVSIDRFTRHDSMDFKHAQLWSRHSSIAETLLVPSPCPLEWFASLKIGARDNTPASADGGIPVESSAYVRGRFVSQRTCYV